MNLIKRSAAWLLTLVMVLGLTPQTVFAQRNDDIAKLSITYHLNSEDGNMIAEPYYADMPKGNSYDVISPEIDNYVLNNPDQEEVSGVLKGDTEIKVVYSYDPSKEVPYKINYIGVNNKNQETILETVTEKAPVDTVISIPFKDFKGYDKRGGEDMKLIVTADGKAEKNVYYDRTDKTYIIFNTNGSYVEPIIAEEGEDISNEISHIEEPTRQGYEFAGWDKELPTTMPKEDYIVNAKWSEGMSDYTVLYWFENAEDENYTLGKNEEIRTAKTNSLVTANDEDIANGNNDKYTGSNDFYGFDYSHCDEVEVQPDGTSVLNVYYKREIWKINYMAKDSSDEIWKTIEGKYFSLIGSKLISDEELRNYYGDDFAYMGQGGSYHAPLLDRFENNVETEDGRHGEMDITPYFTTGTVYGYQFRFFAKSLEDNSDLLIHTSSMSSVFYPESFLLSAPPGFVFDNGYYQTASNEDDVPSAEKVQLSPGDLGRFARVDLYTNIHVERKRSNLTYVSNGEEVAVQENIPYQQNIELSKIPENGKENMKFAGWYTNPALMNSEPPLTNYTMPAEDISLYAKWVPVDRTVTFDTRDGSTVVSQIVPHMGKAKTPAEPAKAGYVFSGWYTSDEERWNFDQPVDDDITLYAYWRPISKISYTVRHMMQGEEQPFFEETVEGRVGDTIVAFPLDPDHKNYPADSYLAADEISKSIVLDSDENENILTFTYIDVAQKDYTVKYLHKLTNKPVAEEKNVKTKNTVVTEHAADIEDYKVTGDVSITQNIKEHKEITFYYIDADLKVTYQFESEIDGQELPEEVIKLIPVDNNLYSQGDTVNIKTPIQDSVIVDDGRWVFKGYQLQENEFVIENDTTITGVWTFEKNAGIINHIPTISVSDQTLTVGDEFDPLRDVSAKDKEDGEITLTLDNVIKNEVDTSKAGVYEVTYKVTDSKGASSIKTIEVTVKEKDASVAPDEPDGPTKPDEQAKPDTNKPDDAGSVKTGDKTNLTLWTLLLVVSGIGTIGAYRRKRKTK